MSILVKRIFCYNNLRNFTYIIVASNGEAWIIDPYEASLVIKEIKKLGVNIKGILNTHDHFDHTRGNQELQDYFNCPVLKVSSGQSVELGAGQSLEVLKTPGHTADHLVFLWKQNNLYQMIFAGDTLFNAGVGNCKNGGNVDELFETTESLREKLPLEVALQPGHDYLKNNLHFSLHVEPSNKEAAERLYQLNNIETELLPPTKMREELLLNPFFRLDSGEMRESLLSVEQRALPEPDIRRVLFKKLRSLRDNW